MEVNKKDKYDNLLSRNEKIHNLIAPPIRDEQPLAIDLIDSVDDEPRYPVRNNREGGVNTSIYELDDSM